MIENHLRQIHQQVEASSERYEHFPIMGDFNADVSDSSMTSFCTFFLLKTIVKESACYKNPENPSCIDLFLINYPRSFHNTYLYETVLYDFNTDDITVDIFKMAFLKNVLNKFAPLKKKYLRANHSRFVNKELNKAFMLRSRLRS